MNLCGLAIMHRSHPTSRRETPSLPSNRCMHRMNTINHFHKTAGHLIPCLVIFLLALSEPTLGNSAQEKDSLPALQKELVQILKNNQISMEKSPMQEVELSFLLNAKNEIVILDITGDSDEVCNYVREVLCYKKVKFRQARQLTSYSIKIQIVSNYS